MWKKSGGKCSSAFLPTTPLLQHPGHCRHKTENFDLKSFSVCLEELFSVCDKLFSLYSKPVTPSSSVGCQALKYVCVYYDV